MNYCNGLNLKPNQFSTCIGTVTLVKFKDFLLSLQRETVREDEYEIEFDQQISIGTFANSFRYEDIPWENFSYKRRRVKINYEIEEDLVLEIYKQAKIIKMNKKPMVEIVEDIIVEYVQQFGSGDIMLVELRPNLYMPTCSSGYRLMHNSKKCALVIKNIPRCMIFQVSKFDNSKYVLPEK